MKHDDLGTASLGVLAQRFVTLPAPSGAALSGFYRSRFIGPWWLRLSAGPSVALAGLPGWQGKRFITATQATNVLLRQGERSDCLSMSCAVTDSVIDGRPVAALCYGADAPRPWRWVRDELRQLDAGTLMGMTVIELPLLRHLSFPFLLTRDA